MRRYEHGGDIYRNKVSLDFSVNTNPLGMPDAVRQALMRSLDACERYPDPRCEQLVRAISRFENVPESHILCGNGASDIIYRLVFSRKPKKALVCAPTFSDYERAVLISGGEVAYHTLREEDGFALTERVLFDITHGTDMVFLCSPNNPTGRLVDPALLVAAADKCREAGALLVVDECFLPFTDCESVKTLSNVAVLKAFTKLYAMAGLRLGYLICGDMRVIDSARDCSQVWSVSALAQIAGIAALCCDGWTERTRELIRAEGDFLGDELRSLGLRVYDSDANFFLLRSVKPLYQPLKERGILVRECGNFVGLDEGYIRIGIKTRAQNEELIRAIRDVIQE